MAVRKSAWILVMRLLLANGLQAAEGADNEAALRQAIDSRSTEEKARDTARHLYETLVFFQVEPGMTVAEALPGGGW
jgi:predicted methyltransferase